MSTPTSKYTFGHPYHGLVTNGQLNLQNGQQLNYPGVTHGDTQIVKVPNQPTPKRTPQEQAQDQLKGFEWRNYAVVTDNKLGSIDLNHPLYQWIIYIDDNKVPWHLRFGMSLTTFQSMGMWCEVFQPFGRIAKQHTFSTLPTLVSKSATINGYFLHPNRFSLERNSRGSEVLVHLYASANTIPGINDVIAHPRDGSFQSPWGLYEVWKLKISGNDLMTDDPARLGEGITATLEPYLSFAEVQQKSTTNIPKNEISRRVNHVSFSSQQSGNPPVPPNCEGVTVDFNEAWLHGLTDPNTNSAGGYFFSGENIVHKVYDWYGNVIDSTNIVRVLYDKDDNEYQVSVHNQTQSLSKKDVSISGSGYMNILNATYQLDGGVCKQQPSPYNRGLNLTTTILQQSKITEVTEIYINNNVVKSLNLEELRTHSEVNTRTVTEDGTYYPSSFTPFVSNNYNDTSTPIYESHITISNNSNNIRDFTGVAGDMPPSPFSGYLPNDDPAGVYKTLELGFISNNLMGAINTNYYIKDNMNTWHSRFIQGMSVPNQLGEELNYPVGNLFGSFQPIENSQAIGFSAAVGWV